MIDFLNQGAESWGAIGKKIPEVDALAEAEEAARKLARRGFTLHLSTGWDASGANHVPFDVDQDDDGALDGEFEADEAWRLTVPPDLQQP